MRLSSAVAKLLTKNIDFDFSHSKMNAQGPLFECLLSTQKTLFHPTQMRLMNAFLF